MNTTDVMALGAILGVWSALIGGLIGALKRLVNVKAAELSRAGVVVVTLLPTLPILLGIATGAAGAFELSLALVGFVPPEGWGVSLPLIGAFVGAGAGAVSGQAVKVYKQTLRGQDVRLDGGADGGA